MLLQARTTVKTLEVLGYIIRVTVRVTVSIGHRFMRTVSSGKGIWVHRILVRVKVSVRGKGPKSERECLPTWLAVQVTQATLTLTLIPEAPAWFYWDGTLL